MEEIIYNKRKEIVERRAQRTLRLEELAEETAEKRAALAALAEVGHLHTNFVAAGLRFPLSPNR